MYIWNRRSDLMSLWPGTDWQNKKHYYILDVWNMEFKVSCIKYDRICIELNVILSYTLNVHSFLHNKCSFFLTHKMFILSHIRASANSFMLTLSISTLVSMPTGFLLCQCCCFFLPRPLPTLIKLLALPCPKQMLLGTLKHNWV